MNLNNVFDMETKNLLIETPAINNLNFIFDYLKINKAYKYICDSINWDENDEEGFINSFVNPDFKDNHFWLIKRKYYLQVVGSFFCYNLNRDSNYAFMYCDLLNNRMSTNMNEKELVDYMYEVFIEAVKFFINDMKIENLFLPLYKDNLAFIFLIEQLGFRKCMDSKLYIQKYPHDIYLYRSEPLNY
ncbi:MAG: hypothetical protein K0S55_182 [Clostridia bacterium]|nr:hypothetical protein [Clostridia bacterium]